MTEEQAADMLVKMDDVFQQLETVSEQSQVMSMAIFVFIGVVLACTVALILVGVFKK